ncbi:hypothetical protein [Kineosporia babensis]|uniref:Uncharacterized protein n=1 Tax=Kineosporia babensis TaxID=499548 RepID=A0A9X1NLV2_9ACTN|nr:hypothetical protein [Kineosporia babensis]MCD5316096.1 hypothetical protein [Kineosporia babensis]
MDTVDRRAHPIHHLRLRDERRCRATTSDIQQLLLVSKVGEEAGELYRRYRGWGSDGHVTAELGEVQDELCAAIMAGFVALDHISPNSTPAAHWLQYLDYGYQRALRENAKHPNEMALDQV